MSSLNGREVKLARLHSIMHIPGVGQLGPAIDSNSASKNGLGSIKLVKVEDGLQLIGVNWEAFVPNGNIISMQFVPPK